MSDASASTVLEPKPASAFTRMRKQMLEPLSDSAPVAERLFTQPQEFDFFQAIRLLEHLQPLKREIGINHAPDDEIVRFRAALGTAFPPSSIAELTPASDEQTPPEMTVAFLGLTGPSGALPAHYSDLLLRLQRDYRTPEKKAIAEWMDLFNHRLVSLFYRAWEKYRPWVAYQRGDYRLKVPDTFTHGLMSVAGLASAERRDEPGVSPAYQLPQALTRYAGLLSQRPRNVANLQAILTDYFALDVSILQFQGQWLALDEEQQTRLGVCGMLGCDTIVGARIWDRQSKITVRIGPLDRVQFERLLPTCCAQDNAGPHLGEFAAVTRFYLGPEIDFDIQLVLRGDQVPDCQLGEQGSNSARLGWNMWLPTTTQHADRDDAVFDSRDAA